PAPRPRTPGGARKGGPGGPGAPPPAARAARATEPAQPPGAGAAARKREVVPWPEWHDPKVAYPGVVGEFVRLYRRGSEAAPAGIAAHFLQAVSILVGRKAHLPWGNRTTYPLLYLLVVGGTGWGRKGEGTAAAG